MINETYNYQIGDTISSAQDSLNKSKNINEEK